MNGESNRVEMRVMGDHANCLFNIQYSMAILITKMEFYVGMSGLALCRLSA